MAGTDGEGTTLTEQSEESEHDAGLNSYSLLQQLARGLHVPSGELQPTLQAIVDSALRTVPNTDDAGLILVERNVLTSVATTGTRPARLDELQIKVGGGPCWDAARSQELIVVADLQHDGRWDDLHQAAAELGIVSMVCLPLQVESRMKGSLSLYSGKAGAFDGADLGFAELFATYAALALAEAQRSEQLRTALASRDVLGQAKGILMERLRIDSDEAFRRLADASQVTNTKVTAVAEYLVRTGELLGRGTRAR